MATNIVIILALLLCSKIKGNYWNEGASANRSYFRNLVLLFMKITSSFYYLSSSLLIIIMMMIIFNIIFITI
uniref:Secreted protein n=1 Tax=Panstrongylus lignarius TaxID=156445 RepID=A0A224XU35_9HEMI